MKRINTVGDREAWDDHPDAIILTGRVSQRLLEQVREEVIHAVRERRPVVLSLPKGVKLTLHKVHD